MAVSNATTASSFTRDDAFQLVDAHARLRRARPDLAAEVDELFDAHAHILDHAVIAGEIQMSAGVTGLIQFLTGALEQRLEETLA